MSGDAKGDCGIVHRGGGRAGDVRRGNRSDVGLVRGDASGDDGRDGVLEDQLVLIVGFEHEGIFIETFDPTGEFDAAEKVNCNEALFFASVIEKAVLDVLGLFFHLNLITRSCKKALPPTAPPNTESVAKKLIVTQK